MNPAPLIRSPFDLKQDCLSIGLIPEKCPHIPHFFLSIEKWQRLQQIKRQAPNISASGKTLPTSSAGRRPPRARFSAAPFLLFCSARLLFYPARLLPILGILLFRSARLLLHPDHPGFFPGRPASQASGRSTKAGGRSKEVNGPE
jgi:hypothetical protein